MNEKNMILDNREDIIKVKYANLRQHTLLISYADVHKTYIRTPDKAGTGDRLNETVVGK